MSKRTLAALVAVLAVPVVFAGPPTPRQQQVHDMGTQVTPFDLDNIEYVFFTTPSGGIEKVSARDPTDTQIIALIQEHLQHETARFKAGDFSDPAWFQDADMRGLATMQAGAARISFRYAPLKAGASVSYDTDDPKLVRAIHQWFTARLSDHGHDAAAH